MDRRDYLRTVGGIATGTALAGCSMLGGAKTGTLAAKASDQPGDIGDFEKLVVTVKAVLVKPAGGDGGNESTGNQSAGNETGATATGENAPKRKEVTKSIDLTKLTGQKSALLTEWELPTGEYEWLKLKVADEVDASLTGGGSVEVMTPGNAPLKFNANFEIRANTRTAFVADFTPVKRGKTGTYVLKPVAEETEVFYREEGTPTGNASGNTSGNTSGNASS